MAARHSRFRERLQSAAPLIGTFLKTPSPIVAEVLTHAGLDAVCIDVEHHPFGRVELDLCIAALVRADMPCLVRLGDGSPTQIRNALDSGATGIVVPHVTSANQARAVVNAARFGEGGRGYAGSTRAAGYTTKAMVDHLSDSRAQTAVIVQIEDLAALENVTDIAAVDGVDCLFVGRVDLAVAMQKSVAHEDVIEAVRQICDDARAAGKAVGMFTPTLNEIPHWKQAGASLFLLSSDQSLMLGGAKELAETFRAKS